MRFAFLRESGILKKFVISTLILLLFSLPTLAEIKVFFSPDGGITHEIIEQIDNAEEYIDVAMYSFTSVAIAEAIVQAKNRGIKVRILLDKLQAAGQYSQYQYLLDSNIEAITDVHAGIMHNKIAVIDGKILLTGSFNWTKSAEEKNEENLFLFIDEKRDN